MNRREALKLAAAMGASLAWKPSVETFSAITRIERRDLFPEGVASGDPNYLSTERFAPLAGRASRLSSLRPSEKIQYAAP